ncbi:nitroreductase family protein [Candidatus Babeliales bacterium]|nr:nitroreductase family protein [Candidatus Babeliales bacterium]
MKTRKNEYPVDHHIINRWSPRAISSDPISDEQLMSLFQAAQQAQGLAQRNPWRFVYAKKGSVEWQQFFDILDPFNKMWAEPAHILLLVLSERGSSEQEELNNSLLTGAACQFLALQGSCLGLVVHAIEGFDYEQTYQILDAKNYTVEVMFALGQPGNKEQLPDFMQLREYPSGRKALNELVFKGEYNKKGEEDE